LLAFLALSLALLHNLSSQNKQLRKEKKNAELLSEHLRMELETAKPAANKKLTPTNDPVPSGSDVNVKPSRVVAIDLEATCCWEGWEGWTDDRQAEHETIEIGAVLLVNGKISGEFRQYVRPQMNPTLSPKCTELTGITQDLVDSGLPFGKAVRNLMAWAGPEAWLVSWGHYDRNQLGGECKKHGVPTDWLKRHTSLKHEYCRINKCRPLGLAGAVSRENLQFVGRHHSGLDDAKNVAAIYKLYADRLRYRLQESVTRKNVKA
jgi:inhibitor of KinA sporulation pathway (predicted exonuclease)